MYQRGMEGEGAEATDKFVAIPATGIEYGQRGCVGTCKRGASGAGGIGYYPRPVRTGVCRASQAETLQGERSRRCAEGSHGAISVGAGARLCLYWQTVCCSYWKSSFQGGLGFLPLHIEVLRTD